MSRAIDLLYVRTVTVGNILICRCLSIDKRLRQTTNGNESVTLYVKMKI